MFNTFINNCVGYFANSPEELAENIKTQDLSRVSYLIGQKTIWVADLHQYLIINIAAHDMVGYLFFEPIDMTYEEMQTIAEPFITVVSLVKDKFTDAYRKYKQIYEKVFTFTRGREIGLEQLTIDWYQLVPELRKLQSDCKLLYDTPTIKCKQDVLNHISKLVGVKAIDKAIKGGRI